MLMTASMAYIERIAKVEKEKEDIQQNLKEMEERNEEWKRTTFKIVAKNDQLVRELEASYLLNIIT